MLNWSCSSLAAVLWRDDPTSHQQQQLGEQALQLTRQHNGAGPGGRGVDKPTGGEEELTLPLLCLEVAWVRWELGGDAFHLSPHHWRPSGELSLQHLGEGALHLP